MSGLSFKYCPICGKELDTGRAKFPTPHSILECFEGTGKYYSDKTAEEYEKRPVAKIFKMVDKQFTVQNWGADNPAGYCKECDRIFAEFEVIDI